MPFTFSLLPLASPERHRRVTAYASRVTASHSVSRSTRSTNYSERSTGYGPDSCSTRFWCEARRQRPTPITSAAIGAVLRTRRLVTVAQISKEIGPATHNVAEYRALIEGLKLARHHEIQRIRVFMDSELVVDQLNGVSAVRQAHLSELHKAASSLRAQFQSIRISWVPREMTSRQTDS
jgi:ribonuclease HI